MSLVAMLYLMGWALGLGSILWAGGTWLWNDIFRPVYWARHTGFLAAGWFKPVHFCTAVLIFAALFTRWPRRWNFGARAIALLVVWVWISYSFAQIESVALAQAIEASKYMIPLIPISMALCYRRAQQVFLYVMAGSVGVWLAHHGFVALTSGLPQTDMAIPGGQMTDRNDFLVAGNACLPLLVYMGWYYRGALQKVVRWGARIAAVFSIGAVFYSLSRGAAVGLALLGIWWAFATGRPLKRIALGIVLIAALLPAVPDAFWERLETIELQGEQTEMSAANRSVHMETAVVVTFDFPLFGVGPDCFPDYSLRYGRFNAEPHSLWLKCSAEYGLPLFLFFVYVVFRLLKGLYRATRDARDAGDNETEALATALSCALVGFLGTGSFTSQFLSQYLWALIGLAGAFLVRPYWETAEEAYEATQGARAGRRRRRRPGYARPAPKPIEGASGA